MVLAARSQVLLLLRVLWGALALASATPALATPACEDPRVDLPSAPRPAASTSVAAAPPGAPRLIARPQPFHHACEDHGYIVFAVQSPPAAGWYRWRVLDARGAATSEPDREGPEPWVFGDDREGSLRFGETYQLEVTALDTVGRASAPVRVPFTFEQTGDAPRFWLLGLVMLAPVLVPALVLIAIAVLVIRSRRASRSA